MGDTDSQSFTSLTQVFIKKIKNLFKVLIASKLPFNNF